MHSNSPDPAPEARKRRFWGAGAREGVAPVREERTIGEIAEHLRGAAKDAWLGKWRRYIAELVARYGLEDPQEIGYDEAYIEDFLLEHCEDLVESECYKKVKQMVVEKTAKTVTADVAQAFADWFEYVKKNPSVICTQYVLPPDVCNDVLKVAKNPCIDRDTAKRILVAFFEAELKRLGAEPKPDLYQDALNEILKIIPEARCVDWQQVVVAQATLDRWLKRISNSQHKQDVGVVAEGRRLVPISLQDLARELGAQLLVIQRARDVDEAFKVLVSWLGDRRVRVFTAPLSKDEKTLLEKYRLEGRWVAVAYTNPAAQDIELEALRGGVIYYLGDSAKITCYVEDAKGVRYIRSCDRRALAVAITGKEYIVVKL